MTQQLATQPNTATIRAVSYSRVSSEAQARPDKVSLEEQAMAARAECDRHGWHYLEDYTERGISGEALEERTALQRLLQDARAGKFDVVICRDQYRLARANHIFQYVAHSLKVESRVQVLLLTAPKPVVDPAKFNPRRDNSRVLEDGVMGMLAEAEGNTRVSVLIQAKKAETAKGRHILGRAPFGYRKTAFNDQKRREVEPNPQTYFFLEMLPGWVLEENLSLREIAARLQRLQVPIKPLRPDMPVSNWRSGEIHNIINNPFYAGKVSYGRFSNITEPGVVYWAEHHYPRPWNEATRQAMLERIASRNLSKQPPRTHRSLSPLSGILKCGYCGGGTSMRRISSGNRRWVIRCTANNLNSAVCQNNSFHLDQFVKSELLPELDRLAKLVKEQDFSEFVKLQEYGSAAKQLVQFQAEQTVIQTQLTRMPRRRDLINQAYQGEVIDLGEYRKQLNDLASERAELEARQKEIERGIEAIEATAGGLEAIQSFAKSWNDLRDKLLDKPIETWTFELIKELRATLTEIYQAIYVKSEAQPLFAREWKYTFKTHFEVK